MPSKYSRHATAVLGLQICLAAAAPGWAYGPNPLVNPGFNTDRSAWIGFSSLWTPANADGAVNPGSMLVTNDLPALAYVSAGECLPVVAGTQYAFAASAWIVSASPAGSFWFFSPTNIELDVKVLDGCALNNRYWFFAAGLTNVNVVLTVTDTLNGTEKIYVNPKDHVFETITDTDAFATCP